MKNLFVAILFAAAALLGGANTHHPAPTSAPSVVSGVRYDGPS